MSTNVKSSDRHSVAIFEARETELCRPAVLIDVGGGEGVATTTPDERS
jgi:hypothetical protein